MSTIITSRRSFLVGLGALIAAPAIVRASVIMPIKPMLIMPEPAIITDFTFPIEGFAQIAGWQPGWDWENRDHSGLENRDRSGRAFINARHVDDGKLADFGKDGWKFTEDERNGPYKGFDGERVSPATVTLRNGEQWQRWKGNVGSHS